MNLKKFEFVKTYLNFNKILQGGLNKKERLLSLCNIFSILIFNEFYLFV